MDRRTAGRLIESLNRDGEVIAERFSLRYRAIAAELTHRGIATKTGNTKWTHTTIARIVNRAA